MNELLRQAMAVHMGRPNLTQTAVAPCIGLTQPTLSHWLRGRLNLSARNLDAVMSYLHARIYFEEDDQ